MNMYNAEVLDLRQALNRHRVRFILVGDFAAHLHKHYRTTDELDLYVEDTPHNQNCLGEALEELKISTKALVARMQFVPGWSVIDLPNGFPLDTMTSVKGLEHLSFDECYNLASIAQIENVQIKFLHYNHLLASKRAANRPKDQIDVLALEEVMRAEQSGT